MSQVGGVILLVEDHQGDVVLFEECLRQLGHKVDVRVAATAEDAFAALSSGSDHQLLVVDLNLPGKDGVEVVREVRASEDERLRHAPIVMMSSSSSPRDVRRCYAAGVSAYVSKKLMLEDFQRDLDAMFRFWLETAVLP